MTDTEFTLGVASPSLASSLVVRHIDAEFTNDIDAIMRTVSGHVCYALPDISRDETVLELATDRRTVRDAYEKERTYLDIISSSHLTSVVSSHFVFHESLAKVKPTSGAELVSANSAVLFPVSSDGIIGEFVWPNSNLGKMVRGQDTDSKLLSPDGTTEAGPSAARLANHRLHSRVVESIKKHDITSVVAELAPNCQLGAGRASASGITSMLAHGKTDVADSLAQLMQSSGAVDIQVVNFVVADWYFFGEYLLTNRDSTDTVPHHLGVLAGISGETKLTGLLAFLFEQ